jgi:hypothetical protein
MAYSERIAPPWWLTPMNKVCITVMRLGLIKDGPMVLTVPGRKSRRRYVVGGFPGADWVRNARAARTERVRIVEVPPDEARPLLHAFPTPVPTGVSFMRNAGRCAVFRFDPAS